MGSICEGDIGSIFVPTVPNERGVIRRFSKLVGQMDQLLLYLLWRQRVIIDIDGFRCVAG